LYCFFYIFATDNQINISRKVAIKTYHQGQTIMFPESIDSYYCRWFSCSTYPTRCVLMFGSLLYNWFSFVYRIFYIVFLLGNIFFTIIYGSGNSVFLKSQPLCITIIAITKLSNSILIRLTAVLYPISFSFLYLFTINLSSV